MKNKASSSAYLIVLATLTAVLLAGCGGGDGGGGGGTTTTGYTVTASAGANGSISPPSATVTEGATAGFTVTPDSGYSIASVTGCSGSLAGNTYTTGAITADCTVNASFSIISYTVTASAGANGSISPPSATVNNGETTNFTVTPDSGYNIASVTGCGGSLAGNTYTTGAVTADCAVNASFTSQPTVSIGDTSIIEGDSGATNIMIPFSVSLPVGVEVITVDWITSDDTATAGSDYTANNGTLTITPGGGSFAVYINSDTDPESDETFTITLSNPVGATLGTATATATILNDDATGVLNDTGITSCALDATKDLGCPQSTHPGQDGDFGRDVTANDNSDGRAGFSFIKIDTNGYPLADQNADYATTPWECVRDSVTGLVWEVKTNDSTNPDLRYRTWRYTWYNSTGINFADYPGVENGGICFDSTNCDTEKYVAAVNAVGLCGQTDWRLPTVVELASLVDSNIPSPGPPLDASYFPNTATGQSVMYWSSSPYQNITAQAGQTGLSWRIDFRLGSIGVYGNTSQYYVRLVRGDL